MKKSILLICLVLLGSSCGQKSSIKSDVNAKSLGTTFPIVVPLSDKAISSFQSPFSNLNPIFRGFVNSIANLGASMGAGKRRLTLTQPIPEIPDGYLTSIKIKRIFFFIDTDEKKEDFQFLRKLSVKISSTNIESDNPSWEPEVETSALNENPFSSFIELFKFQRDRLAQEWAKNTPGLLFIEYDQQQQEKSLKGKKEVGTMVIIQTENPNATRKYLDKEYKRYFTRIHTLTKSILVEFKKDPVMEEMFKTRLAADAQKVEELGIGEINPCSENVCMDLQVPGDNLLPILRQGNAFKIDAYIDPKNAPKSFQLKGFLEFEVKIESKI